MYQDEVSFKQAGPIFRHWALKGIGCVVKSPPTRKSLKVMGAVTMGNDPKFHFRFVPWFNTTTFLTFLGQLLSRYKGKKLKKDKVRTGGSMSLLMEILLWEYLGRPADSLENPGQEIRSDE